VSLTRRNLLMGMVLAQPVAVSLSRLRVKDESNRRICAALNLRQTALTYTEKFTGFSFKRFGGTAVHISPGGELTET
jgi:hypothetical protein